MKHSHSIRRRSSRARLAFYIVRSFATLLNQRAYTKCSLLFIYSGICGCRDTCAIILHCVHCVVVLCGAHDAMEYFGARAHAHTIRGFKVLHAAARRRLSETMGLLAVARAAVIKFILCILYACIYL